MAAPLRIALLLPGAPANEEDPCIPVITTFIREMACKVDLHIFTAEYPYRPGTYHLHGAHVYCTGNHPRNRLDKVRSWRRLGKKVATIHRQSPFDMIHAFWGTGPGFIGTQTAKRLALPLLVSLAGGELAGFQKAGYGAQLLPWSRFLVRTSLANATLLTAGSHWLAEKVPSIYREKLHTIPLGLDVDLFRERKLRSGNRLLAVAALIPVKDYSTLLTAFATAHKQRPDLSLSIVGWKGNRQELKSLQELIAHLSIEEYVQIVGEVPHNQMPELYNNHDLFLHSSLYEAQGMAILEALATGMPVVSTNVGIVPDLPEELVYRVPAGDAEGFAQAILHSHANDTHAKIAYHQGSEMIGENFDGRKVVRNFFDLYNRMIIPFSKPEDV